MLKIKFLKIKRIKKIGKLKTYDISVDKTHNFILKNGLLSHNSQDFTVLGKMPGRKDREEATDQLKRDGKITSSQISDLGDLRKGEYYIIESGKSAKKRYLFLPKCMFWEEGFGDFYKIWKDKNGSKAFQNVSNIFDKLEEDFSYSVKRISNEAQEKRLKEAARKVRQEDEKKQKDDESALEKEKTKVRMRKKAKIEVNEEFSEKEEKKEKPTKAEGKEEKENNKKEDSFPSIDDDDLMKEF